MVWFREDVTIVEDNRTRISVNEDGRNQYSVILELNDVVETDAGLYKVKAKNKYGEVSASINLNFSREYTFTFSWISASEIYLLLLPFASVEDQSTVEVWNARESERTPKCLWSTDGTYDDLTW